MAQQPPPWSHTSRPSQPAWVEPPNVEQPAPTYSRAVQPKRRSRIPVLLSVIGILLALTVVTGFLTSPTINQYINPTSFVYLDSKSAWLIQWVQHDKEMHGTLVSSYLDTIGSSSKLRTTSLGFTGTREGTRVTITFTTGEASVSFNGTVLWRRLTLDIPLQDGSIKTLVCWPGDKQEYSDTVKALAQRTH